MAESSSHRARGENEEIATSTLAEIYAQQGLLGRALAIYRRMLARSPEDTTIAERIDRLERRIAETGLEPEAAPSVSAAPGVESTPAPVAAERERLPWDPPAPETAAPEPALPESGPAPPAPAPARAGPMDAAAFAAWLEGR